MPEGNVRPAAPTGLLSPLSLPQGLTFITTQVCQSQYRIQSALWKMIRATNREQDERWRKITIGQTVLQGFWDGSTYGVSQTGGGFPLTLRHTLGNV